MLALGIACAVVSNKHLLVQTRSSGDNRSWLFITNYKILHLVFCETTLVKGSRKVLLEEHKNASVMVEKEQQILMSASTMMRTSLNIRES